MTQQELPTQQPTHCTHCGASMKEFWHTLTPGLIRTLFKAVKFVRENGRNRFHSTKDLSLSHNEAANFQKLRFHGLVAHADPSNNKSGFWVITRRAGQFLRQEIAVPKKVKTFRNIVRAHSEDLVWISSFRHQVPYFEQDFEFEIHDSKII